MNKVLQFFICLFLFAKVLCANNLEDTLENLILINYQINQMKKAQALNNVNVLENQKQYELKKLTSDFLISKEVVIKNLEEIQHKQQVLMRQIEDDIKKQRLKNAELEKINYGILELHQMMWSFILDLQKNIGIFSQEQDVVKLVRKAELKLKEQPHFKVSQENQKKNLEYETILRTYTEVVQYFYDNPRILLPQNAFINFSVGWILQKIATFVHIDGLGNGVAKILLSLITLIILLACRKFLAHLIFSVINFFVNLSKKDQMLRDKICKDITTPITYVLLVISFDVAVSILYYPNVSPHKIEVWFGISYIFVSVWFFITLLSSYGVGLMGSILKKKDGFRKEAINMILKVSYFFICIIGILVALRYLGFNISAIMASLGIGGLAVALALKDMLANFFASIMLLFENSFSQGDWVVCDGIEGTVVEMGLRRTTIRTFDNALVLVPNSTLANAAITNWNRRRIGRRIKMNIGIAYDSPMDKIQKSIQEIRQMLLENPNIAKASKEQIKLEHYELALKQNIVSMEDLLGYKDNLFVVLDAFEESYISILVYCFSRSVVWGEFLDIKEEVMFKIMKIIKNNGLNFAFPSQSIYVETLPKR